MSAMRLTGVLCSLCMLSSLTAQEPEREVPRVSSEEVKAAVDARRTEVRKELAETAEKPGWAGEYRNTWEPGLGPFQVLEIAPRSGFAYRSFGDLGVYCRNHGTVAEKDGRLRLDFAFPNRWKGAENVPSVLVPLVWREHRYLVKSTDLLAFANMINGGHEPRLSAPGFALHRGTRNERTLEEDIAALPKDVRSKLLSSPVNGMITAVHETKVEEKGKLRRRMTIVTIDRGREHGLKVGHVVHITSGSSFLPGKGTVTAVEQCSARVRIRRVEFDHPRIPAVGWTWSTRRR